MFLSPDYKTYISTSKIKGEGSDTRRKGVYRSFLYILRVLVSTTQTRKIKVWKDQNSAPKESQVTFVVANLDVWVRPSTAPPRAQTDIGVGS